MSRDRWEACDCASQPEEGGVRGVDVKRMEDKNCCWRKLEVLVLLLYIA